MTREEAAEVLREKYDENEFYFAEHDEYPEGISCEYQMSLMIALESLQEPEQPWKDLNKEDVDKIVNSFKKLEELEQKWIPVSERLPEKYGEYLCCDKYGEYIIGYPSRSLSYGSCYVETECEIMYECIAWQPLPEPYKAGEE